MGELEDSFFRIFENLDNFLSAGIKGGSLKYGNISLFIQVVQISTFV